MGDMTSESCRRDDRQLLSVKQPERLTLLSTSDLVVGIVLLLPGHGTPNNVASGYLRNLREVSKLFIVLTLIY